MYNINDKRRSGAERLFELLENVEERYLQEAFMTDDVEKLRELKKEEKIKKRYERSEYGLWYKALACVACLATVVGIVLFGYVRENRTPSTQVWEGFEAIDGEVKIDGIDTLNYYSARRVIGDGGVKSAAVKRTLPLLYSGESVAKSRDTKNDVVYYEFDPAWDFTVTKVTYFRAILKEENGFLAAKLGGIGEVDVIITENSIEDMITFRRGGKYYSCNVNGSILEGRRELLEFTTHKYVDGFFVVKNAEQDNYVFNVTVEKGNVVQIDCDYAECMDGVWDFEADRIGIVSGSSITVKTNVTFNITELESFFNSVVSRNLVSDTGSGKRRRVTAL